MKKKLFIVDGDSLMHIAYNGFKRSPTYTADGMPNYFIRGFIYSFSKYIKDLEIDDTVFVFDSKADTFRHELHEGYKADRKPKDVEMIMQEVIIRSLIDKSGFKTFSIDGYEGDDAVASIALKAEAMGCYSDVIVGTGDKDMYQIMTDTISVYNFNRKALVTKDNILDHFEVPVEQVVDYLCLVGDSADSVKGVDGVGPKRAIALLDYFGSFAAIFDNVDEVSHKEIGVGKAIWDKLVYIKNVDDSMIDFNLKMITLVKDLDVGNDFETVESEAEFESIKDDLEELEINIGFQRFYGRH